MMEVVVTAGAIRCAKLQSNCDHQQTSTQLSCPPALRDIFHIPNARYGLYVLKVPCLLTVNFIWCVCTPITS